MREMEWCVWIVAPWLAARSERSTKLGRGGYALLGPLGAAVGCGGDGSGGQRPFCSSAPCGVSEEGRSISSARSVPTRFRWQATSTRPGRVSLAILPPPLPPPPSNGISEAPCRCLPQGSPRPRRWWHPPGPPPRPPPSSREDPAAWAPPTRGPQPARPAGGHSRTVTEPGRPGLHWRRGRRHRLAPGFRRRRSSFLVHWGCGKHRGMGGKVGWERGRSHSNYGQ